MKKLRSINKKVSLILLTFSVVLIFSFITIEQLFLGNQAAAVSMQNAISKTKEREHVFYAFLKRVSLPLTTLRSSSAFEQYHSDPADTEARTKLQETFITLCRVNPMIMNLRYIDADGMEQLRLERTSVGMEPMFIAPGALQNKSDRYYFQDAQKASTEAVQFSALDLNVEHGQIILPKRYTIRALLPLQYKGAFDGVLVVNYFMDGFLNRFLNAPLYDMILADGNGQILIHHDCQKEGYGDRPQSVTLADDFPVYYKQMLASNLLITDQFVSRKLDLPVRNGLVLVVQLKQRYAIDTRSEKLKLYALVIVLVLMLGGAMSLLLSRTIGKLYADINERIRRQNNELTRSQSKFFTIFQESLDPIVLIDPKSFTIVEFNQRAVEVYGYSKTELASLSFKQLHAAYEEERVEQQIEELIRNGSNRFVVTHTTKNGARKTISVVATTIELDYTTYLYATLHDITQQKVHENELQRLVEQQEALMQIRSTGFAHLKSERFLWTNDTLASMLGYVKSELDTKSIQMMFYDREAYESFSKKASRAMRHTGVYEGEFHGKTKEGKSLYLLAGLTALGANRDEAMLVVNDITTEKKQQNLIESQKEELEAIFRLSKDGIAIMDMQTRFIDTNLAFLQLLGYSRNEMLKRSCLELTAPEDHERSLEMLELLKTKGYVKSFNKQCVAQDGSRLYVNFSATLMPDRTSILITAHDMTEMKRYEEKLVSIAHYDALTGLPNRTLKADRLQQAMLHVQRYGGHLAVLYFDLDGFKEVNDTYGHHMGDKVLVEITRRLKGVLREEDTLSRLGGDEFVGIVVGLSSRDELTPVLDRLLSSIDAPMPIDGSEVFVTVSIGVAFYCGEDKGIDGDQLLRYADQAMYIAKESGKNRYHIFRAYADRV